MISCSGFWSAAVATEVKANERKVIDAARRIAIIILVSNGIIYKHGDRSNGGFYWRCSHSCSHWL